nr:hypothetical protein [Tanacetum cinerariifolium]
MKYLLKISKKAHIQELRRRHFKDYSSDILYAVSIKEDTAYPCLHFTKDHEGNKINTSSDHEDANEHNEKVLEIVDLFHVSNITKDQLMLRVFPISLTEDASRWLRNKPSGLIKTWEDLKTKFLNKYCLPARTAKKIEEINNFQQEPDETLYQAWERFKELLMKCPQHYMTKMQEVILFYKGLEVPTRQILDTKAIQVQLNNLGREIKKVNEKVYVAQVGYEQCKGPHYTKDCPLKEDGSSIISEISKSNSENILVEIGKFVFPVDFVILHMPEDITMPLILRRLFLSTAHAKSDVFKRKITIRVREESIIFKSIKPASSLIKRVYMLGLRERMELDLEARLIGETLVLNRSLDPFFEDYIELNDLKVPLELKRDQADDLMPPIEEGEVVEEFRVRNDARIVSKIFGYPSDCDHDKNIRIDYGYNLKFSCMIDFAVLDDMDAYRDEGMGDVIFGELFFREVGINAKRFEGMITIYNGNEEVIYQIVWSHPRCRGRSTSFFYNFAQDLAAKEVDNVSEESTNLEILKCWSLTISRWLFNMQACS